VQHQHLQWHMIQLTLVSSSNAQSANSSTVVATAPGDIVAVGCEAHHQRHGSQHNTPDLWLEGFGQVAILVHVINGRQRASHEADFTSAVRKHNTDGREHLEIPACNTASIKQSRWTHPGSTFDTHLANLKGSSMNPCKACHCGDT
jgi:hypothetical protein